MVVSNNSLHYRAQERRTRFLFTSHVARGNQGQPGTGWTLVFQLSSDNWWIFKFSFESFWGGNTPVIKRLHNIVKFCHCFPTYSLEWSSIQNLHTDTIKLWTINKHIISLFLVRQADSFKKSPEVVTPREPSEHLLHLSGNDEQAARAHSHVQVEATGAQILLKEKEAQGVPSGDRLSQLSPPWHKSGTNVDLKQRSAAVSKHTAPMAASGKASQPSNQFEPELCCFSPNLSGTFSLVSDLDSSSVELWVWNLLPEAVGWRRLWMEGSGAVIAASDLCKGSPSASWRVWWTSAHTWPTSLVSFGVHGAQWNPRREQHRNAPQMLRVLCSPGRHQPHHRDPGQGGRLRPPDGRPQSAGHLARLWSQIPERRTRQCVPVQTEHLPVSCSDLRAGTRRMLDLEGWSECTVVNIVLLSFQAGHIRYV